MRTQPVKLLLFVQLCCIVYVLLRRSVKISDDSIVRRWVVHNGFCVRPYLHAGKNVTFRLFSDDPNDLSDVVLKTIPKDDPQVFHDDLTLLTHSSASALDEDYLSKLIANWRGPISLAVSLSHPFNEKFVRKKIEKTLLLLKNVEDASRLAVHVLFKRSGQITCEESEISRNNGKDGEAFFASYPINTVRNVARLFSSTRYIAFADADYLFSAGFYKKMLAILRKNVAIGSKNALLYRIFEVEEQDSRLKHHQLTKGDLKTLIAANKSRVFHKNKWPQGHSVPKLTEWLKARESTRPGLFNLKISLKKRNRWEFQFSGLRDVPLFDEAFPYRADNNLELRWELCRAGYRLLPVQDLFVYHTLSHDKHDKDDGKKKHAILQKNYSRFLKAKRNFVKRMELLYPNTKINCPV